MGVLTSTFLFQVFLENSGCLPTFVKYLITNISIIRNIVLLYKAAYTLMSFFVGLDLMSMPYELCVLEQIATAVVYGIVYNKKRHILNDFIVTSAKNNLNERFVQWENVKVSKWLIPLILISVTLNATSMALASMLRSFVKMDFLDATTMHLGIIAAFSFEAQISPLLCIRCGCQRSVLLGGSKHKMTYPSVL
uniref:Uncharacterized protein n=1 Tax=Romanomermis culicivorax TaxID=13658 RepID=A0A915J7A3_ROMCU